MRPQSEDTSLDVEEKLFAHYRAIGAAGRARRLNDICNAAAELALAGIRIRHPGASERELKLRLASTYLDTNTMAAAFGWTGRD